MAHKNTDYKPEDIRFPEQKIVTSELVHEMTSSYIEYAMSVIVGRALPDVRDGLKPVHRRILYAMYEDGLTNDKPFKKSATCVGDVLGRYHPHGDASVYDALVRLAQDFSMRYMLVDGHGNFGSVDGDPPAAYRYTEARMSKLANEMLRDIDKDTVDWDPNFDESRKEPRVLPSRFPNLLVNGSSGIAVGMATNIPPHNLTEVINACICVLDDPEATLSDLMQHVTGPDFPTKGIIMGRAGIRAAYATGRGKIVLRARTEFEDFGKDRVRIIVTELPYQVNKRMLIKSMADQVNEKKLEGISDIRDETDRTGMRIVIELKRDANPQVVLNRLFTQTQLQTSFAINMLALVNNQKQPKILSLRHILDEYLAYQEQVITRRTQYDLKKAREREHLLQGLLITHHFIHGLLVGTHCFVIEKRDAHLQGLHGTFQLVYHGVDKAFPQLVHTVLLQNGLYLEQQTDSQQKNQYQAAQKLPAHTEQKSMRHHLHIHLYQLPLQRIVRINQTDDRMQITPQPFYGFHPLIEAVARRD